MSMVTVAPISTCYKIGKISTQKDDHIKIEARTLTQQPFQGKVRFVCHYCERELSHAHAGIPSMSSSRVTFKVCQDWGPDLVCSGENKVSREAGMSVPTTSPRMKKVSGAERCASRRRVTNFGLQGFRVFNMIYEKSFPCVFS